METANLKKWGWWALGGIIVVLIAAVVIAVVGSQPEKIADEVPEEEPIAEVIEQEDGDDQTGGPVIVDTEETESLPQSGPVEGGFLVILVAGVMAYVVSLALNNAVRGAVKTER